MTDKVIVPRAVYEALEAVRASGRANMFGLDDMLASAAAMCNGSVPQRARRYPERGRHEKGILPHEQYLALLAWCTEKPDTYSAGLVSGFQPDDTEQARTAVREESSKTPTPEPILVNDDFYHEILTVFTPVEEPRLMALMAYRRACNQELDCVTAIRFEDWIMNHTESYLKGIERGFKPVSEADQ